MFLRASVILYMDDDAQRVYKTILAEKDKDMNLPMAKKYEPKYRIKWEWIKNQIYTQMCCSTNDNYYYKPLMTLYHKEGQTRHEWCELVRGAQEEIVSFFGNGHDKIGSRDTVEKL